MNGTGSASGYTMASTRTPRSSRVCRTAIRSVIGAGHAALSAGGYDEEGGPDDEFVFGPDRVLDGVQRLIEARGATTAGREPDA
ncbi:hypothetical protein ACFTWS_15600 [Streptomyces sp. NPDC057027]|uniref:hypothetical protein n=1 Tax=Streptomyces sp. NPDC057027 TaxID=3346004 RepID=UPI003633FE1A